MATRILILLFCWAVAAGAEPLYTYTLTSHGTRAAYDEAMAVASLQGLINRASPRLYVLSAADQRPRYWLNLLTNDHHWLAGRKIKPLQNLDALVRLAGKSLQGAIIWDPEVPATLDVATTMAGVKNGIVLSPELSQTYLKKWKLPVLDDLRGRFTGAETGSKKNDAYRWAIREFLARGLCDPHWLCLYEDAFGTRDRGKVDYVVTRDWAVCHRAFVFDLSPWSDEPPGDEPKQKPGTDLETYKMILAETQRQAAGREMTELTGFFAFKKYSNEPGHPSRHAGVPTEWESVGLMSPYNCYQNTISSACYNESFHSHARRTPLKQRATVPDLTLTNAVYFSFLMGDYDSATPLYEYLPKHWSDPARGQVPLAWAVNPNLLETYPDLFAWFYETATTNDTFVSDAGAAGYINPDRIHADSLPLFVAHNRKFFREADMTMAPMVLDQEPPTDAVKDAYQQFAPDGYATIVQTVECARGVYPPPQVWKGMPVMELLNDTCAAQRGDEVAAIVGNAVRSRGEPKPGFFFFRTDWIDPHVISEAMALLRQQHPGWNCQIVPPATLFHLYKQSLEQR